MKMIFSSHNIAGGGALFKFRELPRKIFPKLRISRRDIEALLREAAHKLRCGEVRQPFRNKRMRE